MRQVLSSLLVIAGLVSGQAIAAPESPPHADIRDSGFVYCVSGQVNTFNPSKASSGLIVDTLAAQFYDRLLDVDPYTYRLMPELAESWEVLDNGATYRFHLRRDVPFQKTDWFTPTRKMNADDVVFTFQRIFDRNNPWHNVNGSNFPYFDSLQFADNVKSVRKLDNHTVEFRLAQPDASFLWHLATHYASVMSAEYARKLEKEDRQEQLDRQPVGTGPYQLSEYRAGQFIRLQRHDDFWRGKPLMPQVVVDLGSGGTGRLSKLLTGECDVLAWPAASQLSILRDDPRLRLTLRPGMNVAYLAFNTAKPPLNNPAVRHALALAINNQRLMQSIYYGTAETAASILPRASWAYDNEAKITEYNPAKSREQLKSLGLENLTLKLWVPTREMIETLLEVRNLSKTFRYRTGWFRRQTVEAVKPLSFTLREGQTLAIIGENGSGKSTLAKMLAGMIEPTSGELLIDDHPLHFGDYSFRSQRIRMIFQDPSTSLNPRQRISQILDFPLRLNTDLEPEQRRKQIIETMRMVGLLPDHVSYYPHMLAPGQKQRLGLARALILRPKVIIADEALASLDMSMRSQLINLMLELQEKQGISYIYVTQHIGMMKHISDQVLVMHQGEVVERGSTADVLASPLHELTKRLIAGHFGEALTADAWRKDR